MENVNIDKTNLRRLINSKIKNTRNDDIQLKVEIINYERTFKKREKNEKSFQGRKVLKNKGIERINEYKLTNIFPKKERKGLNYIEHDFTFEKDIIVKKLKRLNKLYIIFDQIQLLKLIIINQLLFFLMKLKLEIFFLLRLFNKVKKIEVLNISSLLGLFSAFAFFILLSQIFFLFLFYSNGGSINYEYNDKIYIEVINPGAYNEIGFNSKVINNSNLPKNVLLDLIIIFFWINILLMIKQFIYKREREEKSIVYHGEKYQTRMENQKIDYFNLENNPKKIESIELIKDINNKCKRIDKHINKNKHKIIENIIHQKNNLKIVIFLLLASLAAQRITIDKSSLLIYSLLILLTIKNMIIKKILKQKDIFISVLRRLFVDFYCFQEKLKINNLQQMNHYKKFHKNNYSNPNNFFTEKNENDFNNKKYHHLYIKDYEKQSKKIHLIKYDYKRNNILIYLFKKLVFLNLFFPIFSSTSIIIASTGNYAKVYDCYFAPCPSELYINGNKLNKNSSLDEYYSDSYYSYYVKFKYTYQVTLYFYSTFYSAREMFYGCSQINIVDFNDIDMTRITNTYNMFSGCTSLNSIYNYNPTSATDMSNTFYDCRSLIYIGYKYSSSYNNKVVKMSNMFKNCQALTTINMNFFKTKNVENMDSMFENCYKLKNEMLILIQSLNLLQQWTQCLKIVIIYKKSISIIISN